jgi:hypothetical protein
MSQNRGVEDRTNDPGQNSLRLLPSGSDRFGERPVRKPAFRFYYIRTPGPLGKEGERNNAQNPSKYSKLHIKTDHLLIETYWPVTKTVIVQRAACMTGSKHEISQLLRRG